MKYIVKEISEPMAIHKVELILCKLDKASLIKPDNRYANLSGEQLYDKVREMTTFANLKQLLYDEQGGICCYCGMKLEYPFNPQFRVEHVKPRDSHRELVGEYENLLLSCRATKEELEIRRHTPNSKERRKHFHCDEAKGGPQCICGRLCAYVRKLWGICSRSGACHCERSRRFGTGSSGQCHSAVRVDGQRSAAALRY